MECALWYWSHHSIYVKCYPTEREAAVAAHDMSNWETGAPAGVQFPDGSYINCEEWVEYRVENDRRMARFYENERKRAVEPRPAVRRVDPPFDSRGVKATVPADAPAWLGRQ